MIPDLRCPACGASLRPADRDGRAALRCDAEATPRVYPLLGGAIPVLTTGDPAEPLARACLDARELIDRIDRSLAGLVPAPAESTRRAMRLEAHQVAESRNRELLEGLLELLLDDVSTRDVLGAAVRRATWSSYSNDVATLLGYLRRDWSGLPGTELEVTAISEAVLDELRGRISPGGRIVAVGAGLGRVAAELQRELGHVLAVDSSPLMAGLFELLRRGPLEFFDISSANARTLGDQVLPLRASLELARVAAAPDYAIASADALPLADGSVAAIVSAFFSDVIPLSAYLGEWTRVLEPGGAIAHFGPLGYHFEGRREHYPADELLAEVARAGFDVGPARWITTTLLKAPGRIDETRFENLVFSARKKV